MGDFKIEDADMEVHMDPHPSETAGATLVEVGADGSTLTSHAATKPAPTDPLPPQPSLDFLKGADRLLGSFPRLRASLFTAMCVMAQTRSSAFVETGSQKNEKELQRVLKTLQGRFPGRLAYDMVEGDDEDGRGGMLMWNPQQPEVEALLRVFGGSFMEDPTAPPPGPPTTYLMPERPNEELLQAVFVHGMLCPPGGAAPTQTVRFMLEPPPKVDDTQPTPEALLISQEDCDTSLGRTEVLAQLTKYRRVAQRLGLEAHCEIEYDTQQGSFDAGDKVEKHITNTVTLRGQEGPV